jgi:hypothetical protein
MKVDIHRDVNGFWCINVYENGKRVFHGHSKEYPDITDPLHHQPGVIVKEVK